MLLEKRLLQLQLHISLNVNLLFEAKSLLNTSLLYEFILHLVVSILSLETG